MSDIVKSYIKETLNEVATALEKGYITGKVRVGITTLGSELGENEIVKGAELASRRNSDIEVVVIGNNVSTFLEVYRVNTQEEGHKLMDDMLESGELDAAVTNHYNFPLGVSTVGRVITPAVAAKMFLGTTTGTSSTDNVVAMVKNTILSIAVAKACGIKNPEVGILNVSGARQVEKALLKLANQGYEIKFCESKRDDGGIVMRGNDLLMGTPNIMIADSLTGNILMKMFSAFSSGGNYESIGYGYGPGVGKGFDKIVGIVSRASGANVVAGAIGYMAHCSRGKLIERVNDEYTRAELAGLDKIISEIEEKKNTVKKNAVSCEVPKVKITDAEIAGIDILELEDAVELLWQKGVYATSGMGCTGPIVMVNSEDLVASKSYLEEKGFI